MQVLPQRLAHGRDPDLGPFAGTAGGAGNRLFDLLGRIRGVAAIVDAHVDRTIPLVAQARYQPGTQDRGLAQARLAEQHGQELALHPPRQLGDLLVPTVEVGARLFGKRSQAEPRMALVDRRRAGLLCAERLRLCVHCCRARMKSTRRCANSPGTAPPGSCEKCRALNLSGTSASAAVVPSIDTGRINSAPSAMLRTRSMA